jgi:hypothetical protein
MLEIPLQVADPDGDPIRFSVRTLTGRQDIHEHAGLPAGAVYDKATRRIRWTPQPHQAGRDVHLVFRAADRVEEHGLTAIRTMTVRVLPPVGNDEPELSLPVDRLRGRWRVVERLAEVPVAPRLIEFRGNGRAVIELVDYDARRDLARRTTETMDYAVRREPVLSGEEPGARGTLYMRNHRGTYKTEIYRSGGRIILDSYFGHGGLVLEPCRDETCSETKTVAPPCQDVGVSWQGVPQHG